MNSLDKFNTEVNLFLDSRLYGNSPYDNPEKFWGCIDALYSRNDLSLGQKSAIVGGAEKKHKISMYEGMFKIMKNGEAGNLPGLVNEIMPYVNELKLHYDVMRETFEAYQP